MSDASEEKYQRFLDFMKDKKKDFKGVEYFLTYRDAEKYAPCTAAALCQAVRKGRLKRTNKLVIVKDTLKWHEVLLKKDIDAYLEKKYGRGSRRLHGERIWNPEEGRYSATQALLYINEKTDASVRSFTYSALVYMMRLGKVKFYKHGKYAIFKPEDLDDFVEKANTASLYLTQRKI